MAKSYAEIKMPLKASEIMDLELSDEVFVVDKLIPRSGITAISGHPGCGKTWFYMFLAKAIASGENFLDEFETSQGNVLIIEEENTIFELKRRIEMVQPTEEDKNLPIFFLSCKGLKFDEKDRYDIDNLADYVKQNEISVVILDPIISFSVKDENSSRDMEHLMGQLLKLNKVGAAVVYVHHHRKDGAFGKSAGQSLRGSSVLSSRADSHLVISKKSFDDERINLRVDQEKLRRGRNVEPFNVTITEKDKYMTIKFDGKQAPEETKKERASQVILEILEHHEDGLSRLEIEEMVKKQADIGDKNTYMALKELEEDGWFVEGKKVGKKKLYSLNRDNPREQVNTA